MRYLPYTLPILTSQSINLIRFIILNEAGYVVYYSTALLNSIFSPSGNTNVCSYPTPNAFAIAIISSKETVPRFSFLLKFWGVCPIRLQSSARLIFCFSHNSLTISDVVMIHLHLHVSYYKPFG